MKILLKGLKWFGLLIGTLLFLVILAGLFFRLFGSTKQEPQGELIKVDAVKLHINVAGEKSSMPTVVIEGGAGMATEYYHWLSEGLKEELRVVRYDRAGIGYSESSNTPRDPETIARELHTLLENAGESPPYILAGHSMGGPYIRVFAELYPDEVVGLFLLDATHPDRAQRIKSIPAETSMKFKSMIRLYDVQGVLADLGVMLMVDRVFGPILPREMEGLPDTINNRTIDFLKDGKYIRAYGKEMKQYYSNLKRAGQFRDFGALPLRIVTNEVRTIPDETYEKYLKRGINLRANLEESLALQKEYLKLSTNSQILLLKANHVSMFTEKANADIICQEILKLQRQLSTNPLAQSN